MYIYILCVYIYILCIYILCIYIYYVYIYILCIYIYIILYLSIYIYVHRLSIWCIYTKHQMINNVICTHTGTTIDPINIYSEHRPSQVFAGFMLT